MKTHFLITNIITVNDLEYKYLISENTSIRFSKGPSVFNNDIKVFIDGYVMPRADIFEEYKGLSQQKLIGVLFKKYHVKFIEGIKGAFNIVIICRDKVFIFNDRHSIKKVFCYHKSGKFILTNEINLIKGIINLKVDRLSLALFSLFQHFIDGKTLFSDIKYSKPATFITIDDYLIESTYWDPSKFIELERTNDSVQYFLNEFKVNIDNYFEYFKPETISLTLTGGKDTRTILAALLASDRKSHAFTFGFPDGTDVTTALKIAQSCQIGFSNHNIDPLTKDSYKSLVGEIVDTGNTLIHLHRAHRLDAIKKENKLLGSIDVLFVGAMGGDYIKGVSFNDYIVTEFVRRWLFDKSYEKHKLIKEILDKNYVIYDDELIEKLYQIINNLSFLKGTSKKEIEFRIAFELIGCTHDVQDINLFSNYADKVIPPFMDVDILTALFSCKYSLFSNKRTSRNPISKLKGSKLQSYIITKLCPQLGNVPFANLYTPNDVLGNNLKYIIKRIYLQKFKVKSKPTFSYGKWFGEYIQEMSSDFDVNLAQFYNINELRNELSKNNHQTTEGWWHKFSNPIMIDLFLKKYQ